MRISASLRTPALVAAVLTTAQTPLPTSTAGGASANLTFDQADRTFLNVPNGFTGRFDDDAAAIRTASAATADAYGYPEPAGTLAALAGADPIASLKRSLTGRLRRFSFFGSASRVDDLIAQKATIADRAQSRVIYLDLAEHTYREIDGADAAALLAPPTIAAVEQKLASAPVGAGTATIDVRTTVVRLADRSVGADTYPGYRYDTTVATPNASGDCPSVNVHGTTTTYVDPRYPEPPAPASQPFDTSALKTLHEGGCKLDFSVPAQPRAPVAGLQIDRVTESTVRLPLVNMTITTVLAEERAHVSTLSANQAAPLFVIPSGFTRASESAATTGP